MDRRPVLIPLVIASQSKPLSGGRDAAGSGGRLAALEAEYGHPADRDLELSEEPFESHADALGDHTRMLELIDGRHAL